MALRCRQLLVKVKRQRVFDDIDENVITALINFDNLTFPAEGWPSDSMCLSADTCFRLTRPTPLPERMIWKMLLICAEPVSCLEKNGVDAITEGLPSISRLSPRGVTAQRRAHPGTHGITMLAHTKRDEITQTQSHRTFCPMAPKKRTSPKKQMAMSISQWPITRAPGRSGARVPGTSASLPGCPCGDRALRRSGCVGG